ncbi:MAG: amidase [Bryobacteraceae bacterium]|nr:amidase [Bryobacteraceae bacterium]
MPLSRRNFIHTSLAAASALRAASGDLTQLTLLAAAEALRTKQTTSVELTKACLDRIALYDRGLNSFITVTPEVAMEAARKADQERAAGRARGPLHGVPIALKDNIDTQGIRTTAASALFADRVPAEDAEVWRRLQAAGAVLLGKLNLHEFAAGGTTAVTFFGPVRNPYAAERNCGGSSGGSAVAIAADFAYGTLGTDTGGSIRTPASFCGVVGFKPTHGRASIRGIIPLVWSLDHVGPLTKTVADAAVLLQAIAGYDELDIDCVDRPVLDYTKAIGAPVQSFRLGVPRASFYDKLDPEVAAAVDTALGVLSKLTAGAKNCVLPAVSYGPSAGGAETATYHLPYYPKSQGSYMPSTRKSMGRSASMPATTYVESMRAVRLLRRQVVKVFDTVDLVITPTTKSKPYLISEAIQRVETDKPMPPALANTSQFNIFGLPTISIPCGKFTDGIPIGLQITGAPWAEEKVLALAHAYEQATDWHKRRPSLFAELKPYEVKTSL